MNPNQLCHCNHIEKGMIFLRIRGEIVKPWTNGKNSHVSTTHLKLLMLVEGSYCWEVVGVGLSVLAHMPTPPADFPSSCRHENHEGIHSILVHPHTPIGIHYRFLHTGRQLPSSIVLLILMHRILPGFYSCSEPGAVFCHPRFPCEGPFMFFSYVYVFLTDCGLCICYPLPSWEPGFSFHLQTV